MVITGSPNQYGDPSLSSPHIETVITILIWGFNICVSSRLVVVLRPLTHLVTPALFDCCVVVLHLVVTASFCLVVPLVSSSSRHVASLCHSVASCRVS